MTDLPYRAQAKRRGKGQSQFLAPFVVILFIFGFITFSLNFFHAQSFHRKASVIDHFMNESWISRKSKTSEKLVLFQNEIVVNSTNDNNHHDSNNRQDTHLSKRSSDQETDANEYRLAGLNCDAYGGPNEEIAEEMVYWEDIPSDSLYVSQFKKKGVTQYLTFDADRAGWNNARMAMETVVALAIAMGRTLVLPPERLISHFNTTDKPAKVAFSFLDFFPLEHVSRENLGLEIITTQEFLEREALTGNIRDKDGKPTFPPGNRTNWDAVEDPLPLSFWLRENMRETIWDPNECMAVFPASTDPSDIQKIIDIKESVERKGGFPSYEAFVGLPSPGNSSALERMMENWADRTRLCIYDEEMQNAPVVHFPHDINIPGARLLVQFYAFLFFQDWRQDLWMKRFIRDHIRYIDSIQCAAARVVHAIRQRAQARGNEKGEFDSFHIRRGDFAEWFEGTGVDADYIYNISKQELTENATVYIATDETNRSFFDPLAEHYDLLFLDDFREELNGVDTHFFGMIDQLVTSKGRKFFGCWFSTFTGYINRLRGYHANRDKAPGYEQGIIDSWYYVVEGRYDFMRKFYPVKRPFHPREFPTSWRLIDQGIAESTTQR